MPLDGPLPVLTAEQLARLDRAELQRYVALHKEARRRSAVRKLFTYYPDHGPLRRELYPRHLEFFRAGAEHRERLALCANRVGKTEGMGGYETALHLTGRYPSWWEGRRFYKPIRAWLAGKSNETTRDILQVKMLGDVRQAPNGRKTMDGTGLVPAEDIGAVQFKKGGDVVDKVAIAHRDARGKFDGWSRLGLKSYEQKRGSFEGTEQDLIWLDEEPPMDIYTECLTRTMTTQGLVMLTFTPLEGMSEVVLSFLPGGELPGQRAASREPDLGPREELQDEPELIAAE